MGAFLAGHVICKNIGNATLHISSTDTEAIMWLTF